MKKSTWIKLAAVTTQAVPPVVVLLLNAPVFIERTDKAVSAAAILVAVILALIFRDATKKIFQTPSAFKTCLICFLFSLIAVSLGTQILEISATALISGACAIPLNMWYNNETKPATTDDIVKALEEMVKENKDESTNKGN